jgi:hypothetical protein
VLACAALLCPAAAAPAQQRAYATVAVKSLVLRSNKTVSRAVRTRRVEGLTVRARGDFCKGYPRLAVRVDSRRWSTLELTRQWRDYDLPLKLKTGRHVVEVRFANDRTVRGRCSRAVRIAELRLNPGAARRVQLGTALNWATAKVDVAYANAAVREFDAFTPENEMKMSVVEPEPGRFAFGAADQLVNFAMANGKQVRGHALVFDKQTPAWVARTLDANQVIGEMRDYIRAIVTRYKDRVHEWDVVNEAFDGNGRYRETFWYQRLGPRFVELAFQFAREADPTAKLYYNEYVAERPGRQRDAVYNLARNLKQRGLIDGVGLQMRARERVHPPHGVGRRRSLLVAGDGPAAAAAACSPRPRALGEPQLPSVSGRRPGGHFGTSEGGPMRGDGWWNAEGGGCGTSRPTTRCTTPISATSSCATRPAAGTRPRATRRRPARSASASRRPDRARRTSSPRSSTR